MAGRFTDWHHKKGVGQASPGDLAAARLLLGQLEERLRLGGIPSGTSRQVLPNGTVIEASIAMGVPSVRISTPPPSTGGKRRRVLERAYVCARGISGESGYVTSVDLAEYVVTDQGVFRASSKFEVRHVQALGLDAYAVAVPRVDIEADDPEFLDYCYVQEYNVGGGPQRTFKLDMRDPQDAVVATYTAPGPNTTTDGIEVCTGRDLIAFTSPALPLNLQFVRQSDMTLAGQAGPFVYVSDVGRAHPSGQFFVQAAANGALTPWLHVVNMDDFTSEPVFDLTALQNSGVVLNWSFASIEFSRSGDTLYVMIDETTAPPSETPGCAIGSVSVTLDSNAPGGVTFAVDQPFVRVSDVRANRFSVSMSDRNLVFVGDVARIQRSPTKPIERIDTPQHRAVTTTERPYISLDGKHMYQLGNQLVAGNPQQLIAARMDHLSTVDHRVDMPIGTYGIAQQFAVALIDLGEEE